MKYVAALSGGVDSSVAAALAVRAGHEVVGVTLGLKHPDPAFSAAQACASAADEAAVTAVAAQLGIEHHFIDGYGRFRDAVLRPAAQEYAAGRTPNPCCVCNEKLKFAMLFEYADAVGADRVLSGHYASIAPYRGAPHLRRGRDPGRDQTYFLYRLAARELARLDFPVGELEKAEVRRLAAEMELSTAARRDSQDACFQVEGECFGETLRRLFALPAKPGNFLHRGRVVGRHDGIHRYTLGQRKGLSLALGVPAYIAAIDPFSGDIVVETDGDALLCRSFVVDELAGGEFPETVLVQIRFRSAPRPARLQRRDDGAIEVTPEQPLRAVTPGQAAVFYDGDFLLGGGVIR